MPLLFLFEYKVDGFRLNTTLLQKHISGEKKFANYRTINYLCQRN